MKAIKNKIEALTVKTQCTTISIKERICDTRGDGYIDTAIKIIVGVVIGALVLAGLILLWNNVIMPRLNTEVTSMFG
jgi:hypothetical protein